VVKERAIGIEQASEESGFHTRTVTTYVLREGSTEHHLSNDSTIIGRGTSVDIILTGPLVSRRHAELTLSDDGLIVSDLGSRNGVFINGHRLTRPTLLAAGDLLAVGDNTFTITELERADSRRGATISDVRAIREPAPLAPKAPGDEEPSIATRRADALQLLGGVVDKALALGHGEDAERMIGTHLVAALSDATAGRAVAPEVARAAAQYAVKLATATNKSSWLDFVFRLYRALDTTLPLPVVDEMYTVLRRVRGVDRELLRTYADTLRSRAATLSAPERFVLQRLEGLERLAAWQPAS